MEYSLTCDKSVSRSAVCSPVGLTLDDQTETKGSQYGEVWLGYPESLIGRDPQGRRHRHTPGRASSALATGASRDRSGERSRENRQHSDRIRTSAVPTDLAWPVCIRLQTERSQLSRRVIQTACALLPFELMNNSQLIGLVRYVSLVVLFAITTEAVAVAQTTQAVTSFSLINADTDRPVAGFDPIATGATIDLAALPTLNLNMRANTQPATVGSVRFKLDSNTNYRTDSLLPYALASETGGNYAAWTLGLGSHSVTATPYTRSGATGTAGTPLTITFFITRLRINAGGAAYTEPTGKMWTADAAFSGGSTYSTTATIAGTSLGPLYKSERYGNFSYNIPVPNGSYTVTLLFAEIYWTSAGKRVFSVSVEGRPAIQGLDIYAAVGTNTALVKTVTTTVANGVLNITFTSTVDYAKVSAIQVTLSTVANQAPVVGAGSDQGITLPTNSVTLAGTATDDGLPSPPDALTYGWSVVSGPGAVTLSAPTALTSVATLTTAGTYTMRLSVSDSALTSTADVHVTVNPAVAALSVTMSPSRGGLAVGQSLAVTASVQNDVGNAGVTWSASGIGCSGSACGSFTGVTTASATYMAPPTAGIYTITATSAFDGTRSASAIFGVTDLTGVLTYHNNLSRDGTNTHEYALTTSGVTTATFGKLFSCQTDGATYAQPLWVPNVTIGGSLHNVIVVATQHDSVYAFDADASPCLTLWHANLLDSAHGGTTGETSVPSGIGGLLGGGYGDITPEVGVTGTPVVDPATNLCTW